MDFDLNDYFGGDIWIENNNGRVDEVVDLANEAIQEDNRVLYEWDLNMQAFKNEVNDLDHEAVVVHANGEGEGDQEFQINDVEDENIELSAPAVGDRFD